MTTAAALEAITDRSKFERLAASVLRKADPRYAPMIETGVNSNGESIKSPVDGLHLIPHSDPPHYVFVQHTTTDGARLKRKWLTDEGADLPKAVELAQQVRGSHPQAVFTVVLTSNQRLDPQLVIDVTGQAVAARVVPDIWDQNRLADYMDTTPDGQWLRKHHLGVEADRLSADLLLKLGRDSLDLYRQEMVPLHHPPPLERDAASAILSAATMGGLCLVVGRSGFGKSVVTIEALQRHLASGGLGLWLPARVLDGAASLEAALGNWLRELHPRLQVGSGPLAVELGASHGGLMVCLDDVNRTPDTGRLLHLAATAAAPSTKDVGGGSRGPRLSLVVPIWPEQVSVLPDGLAKQAWVRTVHVNAFLPDECVRIIRKAVPRLSIIVAEGYATRLSHDPLLIGLFATQADNSMSDAELASVADDAVRGFIDRCLGKLTAAPGMNLLPAEFLAALSRLAHEMLRRRADRPSWEDLSKWLGEESQTLRAMRALVQDGRICRLSDGRNLAFRHDRIRDEFLSEVVAELLQATDLAEEVIADPFYAAVVGKALAKKPISQSRLTRIRTLSPLALFEAVRQIGEPSGQYHEQLFAEAHLWASAESRAATWPVQAAVSWVLLETDTSRAVSLIDAFEPNLILQAAGLRNGSAVHGIQWIRVSVSASEFEPEAQDSLRDRIVEHATRRHGPQIAEQIRNNLSAADLTAVDANANLALLGHFRFAGFDELIRVVWDRHEDKVLFYAIWAAARCPVADTPRTLGPLIERLTALPTREPSAQMPSEREFMRGSCGRAFGRGITRDAIICLIHAATQNIELREDVSHMLDDVDDPDAAEFVVRQLARRGSGSGIGDGEPNVSLRSLSTTQHLRVLWESNTEDKNVCVRAFIAWLSGTGCKDASLLSHLGPESPLYRTAVQHRIKLADPSAASDLLSLLRANDAGGFWWVMAHRVWSRELLAFASDKMSAMKGEVPTDFTGGRSDSCYYWAKLLVQIPVADASELLAAHWGHLRYIPLIVQAAFRIGTPQCVALAKESLSLCPREVDIFHNAFSMCWERCNPSNPITTRHLQNLEPFLDRLSHLEMRSLARVTERAAGADLAIADWIRRQLVPRLLPESQALIKVSDQSFLAALERHFDETRFPPHLDFLFIGHDGQRIGFPERQLDMLGMWLGTHGTLRGLAIVGECLRHIGTRSDLKLLDRYSITGDPVEIERVKASARFSVLRRTLV